MNKLDIYIKAIFLSKVAYIIMTLINLYLKFKYTKSSYLNNKILFWKTRFEFIFILLMSILLIYLFNPRYDKSILIEGEAKTVFFMLGITLLLTSIWDLYGIF
jgi:hypothetical protein